jgi:hypothetical protein
MTEFLPVHEERLLATLALVKAHPEHWNQEYWHCGTSHCFIGFGDVIARGVPIDTNLSIFNIEGLLCVNAEWFGLNRKSWDILMHYSNTIKELELFVHAAIKDKGAIDINSPDLKNINFLDMKTCYSSFD